MATLDNERGPWLIIPDGLKSPDQIKVEADLTRKCCGERLYPVASVICQCPNPGPGWVCKKCWLGYCNSCLDSLT